MTAPKKRATGRGKVAASFDHCSSLGYGGGLSVWWSPRGMPTLVSRQRFRNDYSRMKTRELAAACRRVAGVNWFVSPILALRQSVHEAGFRLLPGQAPAVPRAPEMPEEMEAVELDYDLEGLVSDLIAEEAVSSNLIAMWRKGHDQPGVTVLDAERCEYHSAGGVERLTVQFSCDRLLAQDASLKDAYIEAVGKRVYQAMCQGGSVTIIKGRDEEWNFAVVPAGKRRGCLAVPEMVSILDDLDYIELAKVAGWNLQWKRKDVIRTWTKGYQVKSGPGSGIESVNMTPKEAEDLGQGATKINGTVDIPMNHDVKGDYLTLSAENFDPKVVKESMDRLMLFGGMEAVVLLGSFSQQNGAAPSLMRNARVRAMGVRGRVERILRMIFAEPEFESLELGPRPRFGWSVKPLYSVEEILELAKGGAPGLMSPQTRRELLDLDDAEESARMRDAAGRALDYVPVFEAGQGLVQPARPEVYPGPVKQVAPPGEPGRPGGAEPV